MASSEGRPRGVSARAVARVAEGVALALAAAAAGVFAWVALARVATPWDLEWMEGAQVLHAREVAEGRALFRAPSADFIAAPYQPLYTWVVAQVARVAGLSLPAARGVSIAATVALAAVAFRVVRRATESRYAAAVACGGVFAVYPATGYWLDLARVDALFLALTCAAVAVAAARGRAAARAAGAALVLFLAFKTKQLAVLFAPAVLVALARDGGARAAAAFVAVFGALLAADWGAGQARSGGWYGFFTWRVPRGQPYLPLRLGVAYVAIVGLTLPLALAAIVARARARRRRGRAVAEPWVVATACGAAATVVAWARPGGAENNFLTTYVFAVVAGAIALGRLRAAASPRARAWLAAAVAAQFAVLAADPRGQVPSASDAAASRAFVARLASARGPVLVPERPWSAVLAGKAPSYHANALWEWQWTAGRGRFPDDLRRRLAAGEYAMVVTSWRVERAPRGWYPPELAARYQLVERLATPPPECVTGLHGARPAWVYAPRAANER